MKVYTDKETPGHRLIKALNRRGYNFDLEITFGSALDNVYQRGYKLQKPFYRTLGYDMKEALKTIASLPENK